MIRKEDYMEIQVLTDRGVYQKDIAEELGIHPKTVSRALACKIAPQRVVQSGVSKLSPYQGQIRPTVGEWGVECAGDLSQVAGGRLCGRVYDGTPVHCPQTQPAKSEAPGTVNHTL